MASLPHLRDVEFSLRVSLSPPDGSTRLEGEGREGSNAPQGEATRARTPESVPSSAGSSSTENDNGWCLVEEPTRQHPAAVSNQPHCRPLAGTLAAPDPSPLRGEEADSKGGRRSAAPRGERQSACGADGAGSARSGTSTSGADGACGADDAANVSANDTAAGTGNDAGGANTSDCDAGSAGGAGSVNGAGSANASDGGAGSAGGAGNASVSDDDGDSAVEVDSADASDSDAVSDDDADSANASHSGAGSADDAGSTSSDGAGAQDAGGNHGGRAVPPPVRTRGYLAPHPADADAARVTRRIDLYMWQQRSAMAAEERRRVYNEDVLGRWHPDRVSPEKRAVATKVWQWANSETVRTFWLSLRRAGD